MENINILKKRLEREIDKLPMSRLPEVLDFVRFLLYKDQMEMDSAENLDPIKDPILRFIGGVSSGSLAKDIDTELYGKLK